MRYELPAHRNPVAGFIINGYAQHIRRQQENAKNDRTEVDELIFCD